MRLLITMLLVGTAVQAGAQVPPVPPAPPSAAPRTVPPAPPAPRVWPAPAPLPAQPWMDWRDHELAARELEWQLRERQRDLVWQADRRVEELRMEQELRALELNRHAWERDFRAAQEAMARQGQWPYPAPPAPPAVPPAGVPPAMPAPGQAPLPPFAWEPHPAPVAPAPPGFWHDMGPGPREGWLPQDPADSLYTSARSLLNRGQYRLAAETFRSIPQRYPSSGYVPDALWWQAQALYRIGGQNELIAARDLLSERRQKFPSAPVPDPAFETRITGALANRGDPNARRQVTLQASQESGRGRASQAPQGPQCNRDAMAIRIEALNALSRMEADSTTPIIRRVLADRDACSERLRVQAIMLLAKTDDPANTDILTEVIRSDSSLEVRRAAVSWLGERPTDRGVAALEEILRSPSSDALHSSALRAIANTRTPRGSQAIRSTIERADAAEQIRREAMSALVRADSAGAGAYLRGIYPRLQTNRLKDAALTGIARSPGEENRRWLMDFVRNPAEPVSLRQSVLRMLTGSSATPLAEIATLYAAVPELELKTQIISTMAGRREPEVVDRLIAMYRATTDTKLQLQIVNSLSRRSSDPKARAFLIEILNR